MSVHKAAVADQQVKDEDVGGKHIKDDSMIFERSRYRGMHVIVYDHIRDYCDKMAKRPEVILYIIMVSAINCLYKKFYIQEDKLPTHHTTCSDFKGSVWRPTTHRFGHFER